MAEWYVKNGWAQVGAAWIKTNSKGGKFLSVVIDNPADLPTKNGRATLNIMPNTRKQSDNHPDYRVSCKVDDAPPPLVQQAERTFGGKAKPEPNYTPLTEDEIPF